MAARHLADFLEALHKRGQLVRVTGEVDPQFEIAALTAEVAKTGGPALLFSRVRGSGMPVVTNLFGTVERVCLALEADSLDAFAERAALLVDEAQHPTWIERLKRPATETLSDRFAPRAVKAAPSQQVVKIGRDVNLAEFPLLRAWPEESAPAITAGTLVIGGETPTTRRMTRAVLAVSGASQLAVASPPLPEMVAGVARPAAIYLGGPPLLGVLAELPEVRDIDPFLVAGVLLGEPLELVRCRTQAMDVPAQAELILEGTLEPGQRTEPLSTTFPGGMCANLPPGVPQFTITAITHRTGAVLPACVHSAPPSELTALSRLRARLLLADLRRSVPECVDLALPDWGGRDAAVVVALGQTYPGVARRVASAIWGHPTLMVSRTVVVVDRAVNVYNEQELWRAVALHARWDRDIFVQDGPAGEIEQTMGGVTTKLGIDALPKPPGAPGAVCEPRMSAALGERIAARRKELGL